jgi:tetratricopeptide (TPR) repeat protein
MKQLAKTLGLLLLLTGPISLKAQTLEENLSKTLIQMDTVKNLFGMMSVSAQFDMIADKWENEWSSNYFAAYAKVILSFIVQDSKKKDLFLDEADKYFEKVKSLDSQNDETYVLAALNTSARITVDGQNRGIQYSGTVNQYLEKAEKINPDNPRIYYLKGSSLFYQPEMYGGGKEKAKPYFEKAKELFVKENKTSILKPHWGEKQNLDYLKQCDEK